MRHICLGKLQRRSDDWITTKLEKGLPVPCDLISRKAITASDVVKPTRGCNGVTKFPKSLKKNWQFLFNEKFARSNTHHHVYVCLLSDTSSHISEMNFIIIANLVKVSEDARDAA